ncbi:MAG: hypothetical protein AAFY24_03255 [Pseudomonadota bacterium]
MSGSAERPKRNRPDWRAHGAEETSLRRAAEGKSLLTEQTTIVQVSLITEENLAAPIRSGIENTGLEHTVTSVCATRPEKGDGPATWRKPGRLTD